MANVKLFWRDAAAAGTMTASTTETNYPVTNAQTDILADKWKTTGAQAVETIVVDLGSAQDITAGAILGHDFTTGDDAAGLFVVQANTTDSWGTAAFQVAMTYNENNLKFFLDTAETYRYWRFAFTKSAASEVRSVGRFMVGQQFICTENASIDGVAWGWEDLSEVETTKSGQHYAEMNTIRKTLSVDFPFSSLTQTEEFQALAGTYGISKPFLISLDDDSKPYDWLFYGRMTDLDGEKLKSWQSTAALTRWDLTLDMIEAK